MRLCVWPFAHTPTLVPIPCGIPAAACSLVDFGLALNTV